MSLADKLRIGQKTMVDSQPVVVASDQTAIPATVAGVATAANQTTVGAQTTKINDGTNTAAVKAASTAAVATDPSLVVQISPNTPAQALPTGAATAANQSTQITSLSNIDTNTQYSAAQSAALPTRNAVIGGNGSTTIPTAATEGTTTRQWYSTTGRAHTMNDPGYDFAAVTPNDAANLPTVPTRALYVGTGGNIVVDSVSSTSITFRNVPPGTMLPIAVYRVRATSTTASNIVAIY